MNKTRKSSSCPRPQVASYFQWKGYVDQVLALILLIPSLPVIGLLIAIVRLSSKGPAVYSQVRVGQGGKTFTMYKIRSMRLDAEAKTGAVWAARRDPRITWIGGILRKLHLDELPQLFNVLRGDMSLVGPRPERPEFVSILSREIDGYDNRLMVKPGVTGYAQLNLPSDIDLSDVRRKLVLDFEYIEGASPWFDFRLIVGTASRFVKFAGCWPLVLCGIYRNVQQSSWARTLKVSVETTPVVEEKLEDIFRVAVAV